MTSLSSSLKITFSSISGVFFSRLVGQNYADHVLNHITTCSALSSLTAPYHDLMQQIFRQLSNSALVRWTQLIRLSFERNLACTLLMRLNVQGQELRLQCKADQAQMQTSSARPLHLNFILSLLWG